MRTERGAIEKWEAGLPVNLRELSEVQRVSYKTAVRCGILPSLLACRRRQSMASDAALFKSGRPAHQDNPQKITLHLALVIKRKAFDLATTRRCSIGRLVEDLIAACKE